jgi:hypothetical protein
MDTLPISLDGTIVDGSIQLDQPVNLANHSRVKVTVMPVVKTERNRDEIDRKWEQALRALEQLKKEHPINSGGAKLTREELYDRG